jgi:MOSC domain-containing protein YiiM
VTVAQVTQIHVYPVSGQPGRELEEASVDAAGLAGDRRKKAAVHVVAAGEQAPDTRANLVVSLTPTELAAAIGGVLVTGSVELDVTGTARDCPGVYAAVRHPGVVRVGDEVTAVGPGDAVGVIVDEE